MALIGLLTRLWLALAGSLLLTAAAGQMLPAGSQLAFMSTRTGENRVYLMDVERGLTHRLSHRVASRCCLAWSPDGKSLTFVSDTLPDGSADIYAIMLDDGRLIRLTETRGTDTTPVWSPDGSRIAFVSYRDGNAEIYHMAPDGSDPQRLTYDASIDLAPAWSPDGSQIAFTRTWDSLRPVLYRLQIDCAERACPPQQVSRPTAGDDVPHWLDGQTLSFVSYRGRSVRLFIHETGSQTVQPLYEKRLAGVPAWTPEGDRAALINAEQRGDLEIFDRANGTARRLLADNGRDEQPAWSPGNQWLAFVSDRAGSRDIYLIRADGGSPRRITDDPGEDLLPQWRPE